jgi:hypothetical protein
MMREVVEVVGTGYYNGLSILRNVIKDHGGIWNVGGYQDHEVELVLQPEPDNPYDSDAILVLSDYQTPEKARVSRSGKIGYLPRGCCPPISDPVRIKSTVREGFGAFWVKIDTTQLPD